MADTLDEEAVNSSITCDDSGPNAFLPGLPRRYVLLHSPAEIATHSRLAEKLAESVAQVQIVPKSHGFELTVITRDRPGLFAAIAGMLAAWRMNVLKADAFANAQGVIVDTFQFADTCSTLTLNPSELERFQRELVDLLSRDITSATLQWLNERARRKITPPKVAVQSRIWFDDTSSCHSTIMEVVTHDRPGLLYDIASTLANAGYSIDVALIDTEGQKAIDVLYLSRNGRKLTVAEQHELRAVLSGRL
jgi:[protein-PII] uridylyltransferase